MSLVELTGEATACMLSSPLLMIMTSVQGNVWQQLWQTTAGRAASAQEPLMNAEKEAERVFHDLEQVPPRALWDQLLALAAVAAAAMLAACDGAALLPARQQFLQ